MVVEVAEVMMVMMVMMVVVVSVVVVAISTQIQTHTPPSYQSHLYQHARAL
jgi:hypothetical protein